MAKTKFLNLFEIDDREFEYMVAELLRVGNRLREVEVQPRTMPDFDIVGIEDAYSNLGQVSNFRVGVQVKQSKTNIGKDVFDGMSIEAEKQNIRKIMLVSASDFKPSAIESARRIQEKGWIFGVILWNNLKLRQELARNPLVLKKYFDIDLIETIGDLVEALSSKDEKRVSRIVDHIKKQVGLSHLGVHDIFEKGYLDIVKNNFSTSSFLMGQVPEVKQILDSHANISRQSHSATKPLIFLPGENPIDRRDIYSFYESIEHFVVIGDIIRPKGFKRDLCRIHDRVNYVTQLEFAKPFIFRFVLSNHEWSRSHTKERNEYTWMLPSIIDSVERIEKYIAVKNMIVNDIRLHMINKFVNRERLEISMYAKKLKTLEGKRISVQYKVENVYQEDKKTMFSSLHESASQYRFILEHRRGFGGRPDIKALTSNLSTQTTQYDLSKDIQRVSFEAVGLVPEGTGIVITW
jgi:hypothetical protein